MTSENQSNSIPSWLMILVFVAILAILGIFGDLFTFILGAIVEILIFAAGYNKKHLGKH